MFIYSLYDFDIVHGVECTYSLYIEFPVEGFALHISLMYQKKGSLLV